MPELRWKQSEFIYSACGLTSKTQKEDYNLKKQDSRYIYQNKLDKACLQNVVIVHGDFKDLN